MTRSLMPKRRKLAMLALPLAMILLAACGNAASSTGASGASSSGGATGAIAWKKVTVNVGGRTISVQGPPRIAYFPETDLNTYLTIRQQAIEAAVAKIPGATVTVYNSDGVALTQENMIQNAISSRKFNAFIVDTDDGAAECNMLTQTAPAANIAVVNVAGPLCNLSRLPNPQSLVAAGEAAIIENNSIDALVGYLNYMIAKNPGPQKVIVLTGPTLHPLTYQIDAALKVVTAQHPEFRVVAEAPTDFSTLEGQQEMQSLLTAHPNATIFFSAYSDITVGALTSIASAGRTGKMNVYDIGGSKAMVADIRNGTVQSTTGGYPTGSGQSAVRALLLAFQGHQGPRVILGDGGPVPPGSTTGLTIIDKSNVSTYSSQY